MACVDLLISVIIPVYNVEQYLRKCVDSILCQTHRNLEIILVNDGSTDHCGAICDEYASLDSRICVIHKVNGGLSSARNAGLDIASGDYYSFVDSDDWLEPDALAYLLTQAEEHSAEITVCGRIDEYEGKSVPSAWDEPALLNKEQAILHLLTDPVMQSYAWNKLWKKSVFAGIRFPEGRNYEDVAVIHRAYERAERILCLPGAKYHYLQRSNSIVRNTSLRSRLDYWTSAKQRYDELRELWPQYQSILEAHCAMAASNIWSVWILNSKAERDAVKPQLAEMSLFVKERLHSIRNNLTFGITGRITVRLIPHCVWWSFLLAYMLARISELKHGHTSS